MATSLAVPVAYITVLVTALAIFSRVYRRRKLAEQAYEPWFPSHPSRDFYISLLSSPDPLDNMVKSALLLRAIEDVKRIWRIRDDKAALTSLHTRGLLGDDTKARFEFAEKELEAEILDVVQEANSFKQGWGTLIFATATEMAQAERTRETVLNIPKIRQREEKRLAVRRKYLPETTPAPSPAAALQSAPAPTPAQITSTPQKGSSTSTSTSGSAPGSGSSTPAQAVEKEGTTLSPQGAGGSSTTSTPNKNTPSKKKKGKK